MTELNRPDAAERVAAMLMEKYPKTAGVLASVLAARGRRDEALKLYIEAIKIGDPDNVREAARNSLALITRDKHDPATIAMAEKVIDSARAKDPTSSDLLAMAGYLRHFQDRYQEEVDIYKDALEGKPDDFTLMNNMAWTLSEGLNKPEEALARINEAIKKSILVPPHFYDTRGVIYTRLGKVDEAIRDLELAVQDRPTGLTWAHLARAYHKAGKLDKFREARDQAKKARPPLTPDMLEKTDRAELEPLIFGQGIAVRSSFRGSRFAVGRTTGNPPNSLSCRSANRGPTNCEPIYALGLRRLYLAGPHRRPRARRDRLGRRRRSP